jgi:Na+/H+ antiporter NhaD/arsenite permease-like protein
MQPQNVNVFTHYTHKLAYEADQKRGPRRRRRPIQIPLFVKIALLTAIVVALVFLHSPAMPALVGAASAWAGAITWIACKFRERLRKVARALSGQPIEADDLQAFSSQH